MRERERDREIEREREREREREVSLSILVAAVIFDEDTGCRNEVNKPHTSQITKSTKNIQFPCYFVIQ